MPTIKIHIIHQHRNVWRLIFALTLAVFLCLISISPASAQDLSENFQFSYDPVTFDKNEINGSEVFHVNVSGRVTCVKDLPMKASEANLTSQVVAVHTTTGTEVMLNSSYTITVKPFPAKAGETAEISQSVPLQFPAQAKSGDYNIIGKIKDAKVKVLFAWIPVTGYLPQEQPMGTVKYITSGSPATPPAPAPTIPENPPSPEPLAGPPPLKSTPSGDDIPVPQEQIITPPPTVQVIPWWVWLIVVVAGVTTVINIVSLLRRRAQEL